MDRDRWMQRTLNEKRMQFIELLETELFAQFFPDLHRHIREKVMNRFRHDNYLEANSILFDSITRIDDFPNKFLTFCKDMNCVPQLASIVRYGLMKYDKQHIRPKSSKKPNPPVSQEDPSTEHDPDLDQMQHILIASFQPKELPTDSTIDDNDSEAVTSLPTGDRKNQEQIGSDKNNINDSLSNDDSNSQEDPASAALGAVGGIDPEVKLDVTVNVCDDCKTETEKHVYLDRLNDGSDTYNNLNRPTLITKYEGGKVHDGVQSNNRQVVLERSPLHNIETDAEIQSLRTFDQNPEYKRNDRSHLPETSSEKNNQHDMYNADSLSIGTSKVNSFVIESTGSFYLESSDIENILPESDVGKSEDLAEQTIPKVHEEIPEKPWPKPHFVKSAAGIGGTQCQEDLEKNCVVSTALQLKKLDYYSNLSDENTVLKSTVIRDSPDDCERDPPPNSDKFDNNASKKSGHEYVDIGRNKACLNKFNSDNLQDAVNDEDLPHCDSYNEVQKHQSFMQADNVQDKHCPLAVAISQQQESENGPLAPVDSQDQMVPTEICGKTVNVELHKNSTMLTNENSFNTKKPTQQSNLEDFQISVNASASLECPENESFALSNPFEWNDPRLTDYNTSSVEIQYSATSAVDTSQSIMTDSYDADVDTSDTVIGSCGNNTGASSSARGDTSVLTSEMTLVQTRQRKIANLQEIAPNNCNVPNAQSLNQGCKKTLSLVNFSLQNLSSVALICVALLIIIIGYVLISQIFPFHLI